MVAIRIKLVRHVYSIALNATKPMVVLPLMTKSFIFKCSIGQIWTCLDQNFSYSKPLQKHSKPLQNSKISPKLSKLSFLSKTFGRFSTI